MVIHLVRSKEPSILYKCILLSVQLVRNKSWTTQVTTTVGRPREASSRQKANVSGGHRRPVSHCIMTQARSFLEAKEGYWTRDKFMNQFEKAVMIAEVKYPQSRRLKYVRIFDHSSCHATMSEGALDVSHMKVNQGGK